MGKRTWIDIPANKWYQEDALSTEISKFVMRLGRHLIKTKEKLTALLIGIRRDQHCEMRS